MSAEKGGSGRRDSRRHLLYRFSVVASTIGIREAKAQLSRLVSEAERGTEWIITDRGRPVAKLAPLGDMTTPVGQAGEAGEVGLDRASRFSADSGSATHPT